MSGMDPLSRTQVEALARKVRDGKASRNEAFEVNRAIKAGLGDVERIRDGKKT